MPPDPDSRELLLALMLAERDKQLVHFEGLDTKAGLLLGVAVVVTTLAPDVPQPLLLCSLVAALIAGGSALSALWPRRYPVLSARRLTEYAAADPAFTRRFLLDTAEEMVVQASRILERKTARLKVSFVALSLAGLTLAIGIGL